MVDDYISVNIKTTDAAPVRGLLRALFTGKGYKLIADVSASAVFAGGGFHITGEILPSAENQEPNPDDHWDAVLVSGVSGSGWVSVYDEDWWHSRLIAKHLSRAAQAPVLEVWMAGSIYWGYNYYENGEVRDRFTSDPTRVASDGPAWVARSMDEATAFRGDADMMASFLQVPGAQFRALLREARDEVGQPADARVATFAQMVGLPPAHVLTSYDHFFDDPQRHSQAVEYWLTFRHLGFDQPRGRYSLSGEDDRRE